MRDSDAFTHHYRPTNATCMHTQSLHFIWLFDGRNSGKMTKKWNNNDTTHYCASYSVCFMIPFYSLRRWELINKIKLSTIEWVSLVSIKFDEMALYWQSLNLAI